MAIAVNFKFNDGIEGNNAGTLTWSSSFATLDLYDPITKTRRPVTGNGSLQFKVDAPATPSKCYPYVFFNTGKSVPLYTYMVKVFSQPLVFARWIPAYNFDKNAGARNGIGELLIRARGAEKVKILGFEIDIPAMLPGGVLKTPCNLPIELAYFFRDPSLRGTAEAVLTVGVTGANGTEKRLRLSVSFG